MSENIVLGCLIKNINWFEDAWNLKEAYFSTKINKEIFKVLKRLYKKGAENVDVIDVYAEFEASDDLMRVLEKNLGIEYLETVAQLGDDRTINDMEAHAQTIEQCAFKNDMYDLTLGIQNDLKYADGYSIQKIFKLAESRLLNVRNQYDNKEGLKPIKDVLDGELARLDRESSAGVAGFPTFSPTLNKFLTYEKGECVLVSGEKKTGKSQYVINEVYRLCIINRMPTIILDSELSTRFFINRMISRITGYNIKYIRTGKYKESETASKKVHDAIEMIRDAPLCHKYIVGMSETEIVREVKRLKLVMNVQLLFYDYIKADTLGKDGKPSQEERLQLAHISNWLKNDIAGELDIAVVALTQTMPSYKGERNLKVFGSNQVAMNVSAVLYLIKKTKEEFERDFCELGGNYMIYIADNRNGVQFNDEQYGINISFNTGNCTMKEVKYQDNIKKYIAEQEENYGG